jgi:hypothetical protein
VPPVRTPHSTTPPRAQVLLSQSIAPSMLFCHAVQCAPPWLRLGIERITARWIVEAQVG